MNLWWGSGENTVKKHYVENRNRNAFVLIEKIFINREYNMGIISYVHAFSIIQNNFVCVVFFNVRLIGDFLQITVRPNRGPNSTIFLINQVFVYYWPCRILSCIQFFWKWSYPDQLRNVRLHMFYIHNAVLNCRIVISKWQRVV